MYTDGQHDFIPDELLKTKLLRNGFWMYFFAFLVAPTGYIIKLMIAQSLSVEAIGIFYSVMGLVMILSAYNDLGLTEALQYYLPRYLISHDYDKTKSIALYTLLLQLASGLLIGSCLYIGSHRLSVHYFQSEFARELLKIFSLYFLLINIAQAVNSFFLSTQRIKRSQGLEALRMIMTMLGTGMLWLTGTLTLTSFALVWLGGVALNCLVGAYGVHRIFGSMLLQASVIWSRSLFNQQWKYGIWVMIGAGAGTLIGQINQQFALMISPEAAGYRAYYLSFYTIVGTITGPLIAYLFPLLNELRAKDHYDKIVYLYRLLFAGVLAFGILGGLAGYFLAQPVAVLLFGESFRQAGVLFQHYAPWIFTLPLIGILFQDIASRGLVRQRVYVLIIALLINALASIVLSKEFGLTGLVYAQLVGNLVLIAGGWWYFQKKNNEIVVDHRVS